MIGATSDLSLHEICGESFGLQINWNIPRMFPQNRLHLIVSTNQVPLDVERCAEFMEAAGIEPASENVQSENLHACQVPICYAPTFRTCEAKSGHEPVKFRLASPGQQFETILPEVSSFNQPTGELIKNVAGY